ncbi:MAG: helix-turn-helix transcriptional regulator [Gemmatimonadales bacterium]|nr:helix-turn-helix transcriptional regulator [Gemmatimonadales bacterium]MDZ4389922.1 helix-turn-helix transcriptional regulator [Gemmatimonadales bacterium]
MTLEPHALYTILGARIRAARDRVGVSQAKLAHRLSMTRTSIVNIEAGRQRPPLHVIWAIAEELRTEVALLLPSRSDYSKEVQPVELDQSTITQIETAANGDPRARRDLIAFIGKARQATKEPQ